MINGNYEFSHALAVADFNGDSIDEIIGGDRAKDMAVSDCTARDMNGNQWMDINLR